MTQIWKDGKVAPVTMVAAHPNKVSLIRTEKRDGYRAVQLQLGNTKCEFPLEENADLSEGDSVKVSIFNEGDLVRVTGTSKGRGFQGTTKRYNFGGAPATHGQKDKLRATGSIGTAGAGRVWKGRKMPGRMGGDTVSVKNLEVIEVRPDENKIFIKGAIPGPSGGIVEIARSRQAVPASSGNSPEERESKN